MTVFYASDTHLGHAVVAGIRGFTKEGLDAEGNPALVPDVAAHDEHVIARWNAMVRPGDFVWHLGDVGLGKESEVLAGAARLNGTKHLVAGNHDRCWPGHRESRNRQRTWLEVFESVQAFARTKVAAVPVLLSHMPYQGDGDHTDEERYPQFRLPDLGGWLIHGHTHSGLRLDAPRSVHIGLDAWGLAPVPEAEVAELIRQGEALNNGLHTLDAIRRLEGLA